MTNSSKEEIKQRNRPNAWENRYNQWVLAGKIALQTNAMPKVTNDVTGKKKTTLGDYNIYCTDSGEPHYSMIGQEYLRRLNLTVTDF